MRLLKYIWKNTVLKCLNSKMAVFVILMLVTSHSYLNPLRQFSMAVNYPVSWCVFPFAMCSFTYLIMFWFGVIYVNSDVPFMQHVNMYHAIRVGRRYWGLGQIGGIFLRSLIMVLITIFSTILPLLPKIEWSNGWGKLLRTAATTNALSQYQSNVVIYSDIFSEYTPLELMVLEILVCTLICTFVGVLMFFLSLYMNKIIAVAGGLALAIALFPVLNMHPLIRYKLAKFIPTVWAELARIATVDHTYYWLPSLMYMVLFLLVGLAIMTGFIMYKIRHVEFNWDNEDM